MFTVSQATAAYFVIIHIYNMSIDNDSEKILRINHTRTDDVISVTITK